MCLPDQANTQHAEDLPEGWIRSELIFFKSNCTLTAFKIMLYLYLGVMVQKYQPPQYGLDKEHQTLMVRTGS